MLVTRCIATPTIPVISMFILLFYCLVSFSPTNKLHVRHHMILTIVIIIGTLIIKSRGQES